jgi:hypothetical protein
VMIGKALLCSPALSNSANKTSQHNLVSSHFKHVIFRHWVHFSVVHPCIIIGIVIPGPDWVVTWREPLIKCARFSFSFLLQYSGSGNIQNIPSIVTQTYDLYQRSNLGVKGWDEAELGVEQDLPHATIHSGEEPGDECAHMHDLPLPPAAVHPCASLPVGGHPVHRHLLKFTNHQCEFVILCMLNIQRAARWPPIS